MKLKKKELHLVDNEDDRRNRKEMNKIKRRQKRKIKWLSQYLGQFD